MLSETSSTTEYTLPGVLHYLQVEWRRFERERNEWAIERAELKARIALLEGERRGIENLKMDMMRRVKMLEYALKQERTRHFGLNKQQSHVLDATATTGSDSPNIPSPPTTTRNTEFPSVKAVGSNQENSAFKARERSRQVLKSCLEEIDYLTSMPTKFPLISTENTSRLDSTTFTGRGRAPSPSSPELSSSSSSATTYPVPTTTTESKSARKSSSTKSNRAEPKPSSSIGTIRASSARTTKSPQLSSMTTTTTTDNNDLDETGPGRPPSPEEEDAVTVVPENVDEVAMLSNAMKPRDNMDIDDSNEDTDIEADELVRKKRKRTKEVQEKYNLSEEKVNKMLKTARKENRQANRPSSPEPQDDAGFSLKGDISAAQIGDLEVEPKKQEPKIWKTRVTIKGHLDSVRSVNFHPTEMILASGSDDGTVKVWNLKRSMGRDLRKGAHEEADPTICYRGHTNVVTGVIISAEQKRIYSASLDSTIRVWRMPPEGHTLFSAVDPSLSIATYVGHTDAIWDIKLFPAGRELLASASADGSVKIWDTQTSGQLLKSSLSYNGVAGENDYLRSQNQPIPTSIDFCHTDLTKMAVSFSNAEIKVFDIETGQIISTLQGSNDSYDGTARTQINRIVAHPTMPLVVSGHEDRQIKFFDLKSGNCAFSMSAHLDAVSCIDIDPSGMYLASGGHDSSIRLWDISMSKTCMQEFSAHRRKGHEGVLSVHFHKSYPWLASGGADGVVKGYHHGHH